MDIDYYGLPVWDKINDVLRKPLNDATRQCPAIGPTYTRFYGELQGVGNIKASIEGECKDAMRTYANK